MEDVTILAITRENDETNIVLNSDLVLVFDSLKTTFEIMIEGEIINRNTLIAVSYTHLADHLQHREFPCFHHNTAKGQIRPVRVPSV